MTKSSMSRPHVAILVETSTSWGTNVIRGVAEFARRHGPWSFDLEPHVRGAEQLLPRNWHGSGVIARVTSKALAEQIRRRGLPAVNVSWYPFHGPTLARCTIDDRACARLAFEHFRERRLQNFAYCPAAGRPDSADPLRGSFHRLVAEAGFHCAIHRRTQAADRTNWLRQLARPVGVLAFSDLEGRLLAEACFRAGIRVPDETAILGAEYDELMSSLSDPPLSCIQYAPQRVGFEAARILQHMMNGGRCPAEVLRVPPTGVVTRRSTDTLAVHDPLVAAAIRFIRTEYRRPIQVEDLVNEMGVSRRGLEQHFQSALGRSPAAEIRRVRIMHAHRLLADTSLSIQQVAVETGFNYPEVLNRIFHSTYGLSPTAYRRRNLAFSLSSGER